MRVGRSRRLAQGSRGSRTSTEVRVPMRQMRQPLLSAHQQPPARPCQARDLSRPVLRVGSSRRPRQGSEGSRLRLSPSTHAPMGNATFAHQQPPARPCHGLRPLETTNCESGGRAGLAQGSEGSRTSTEVEVPMRQMRQPLLSAHQQPLRGHAMGLRPLETPYCESGGRAGSRKAPSGSRTSTEVTRYPCAKCANRLLSALQQPPARPCQGPRPLETRIASREVARPRARLRVARGLRLRYEYPCAKCANRYLRTTTTQRGHAMASDLSRPRIASREVAPASRKARGLRTSTEVRGTIAKCANRYFPHTNNHLRGHAQGPRLSRPVLRVGRSRRLAQGSECSRTSTEYEITMRQMRQPLLSAHQQPPARHVKGSTSRDHELRVGRSRRPRASSEGLADFD